MKNCEVLEVRREMSFTCVILYYVTSNSHKHTIQYNVLTNLYAGARRWKQPTLDSAIPRVS
jgi:hypothetical protein